MWASGGATIVPSDHKPTPTSSTVAPPILQPSGHVPVCCSTRQCTHLATSGMISCAKQDLGWLGRSGQPGKAARPHTG